MGLRFLKKWIWLLVFFSLALNIGFIYSAADQRIRLPGFLSPPAGQGTLSKILDKMDLPKGVRENVTESFEKLRASHLEFAGLLLKKEKEILDLMGRPGKVDMGMISPLIASYSQISKESALDKARYMIEIRALLGPEDCFFSYFRTKERFQKEVSQG